jgi:hypothetical protein
MLGRDNRVRVRDYVYVSDGKIDMLFGQIPRPLAQRISAELRIDLKLISVSLREERATETRYAKLAVVETYVRRHLALGSVDDPALYVCGTLPMRWGPYGLEREVVLFAGASERTLVALGGSFAHVLGSAPPATRSMRSAAPVLYQALADDAHLKVESAWPRAVVAAARELAPPTQRLEFFARVIGRAEHEVKGRDAVLLGSPLYVANAP